MHFGTHEQLVLLALLLGLAAMLIVSPIVRIPYPILLVLAGLAISFIPGMPTLELPPEVVLVAVLPPLLYYSAYSTSLRDLRQNARAISLLAIGLVIATTCAVAVVAHELIDGFSWSAAFVLGAVVSPTDPLAATKITRRLGVPRRIIAVIGDDGVVFAAPRNHLVGVVGVCKPTTRQSGIVGHHQLLEPLFDFRVSEFPLAVVRNEGDVGQ